MFQQRSKVEPVPPPNRIAIITIAFAATFWITSAEKYRKFVVIPGSILIALAGIFWVVERTLL